MKARQGKASEEMVQEQCAHLLLVLEGVEEVQQAQVQRLGREHEALTDEVVVGVGRCPACGTHTAQEAQ